MGDSDFKKSNEQLKIALEAAYKRLELYEVVNSMALAVIAGTVISPTESRPILVSTLYSRKKEVVLAVYPTMPFHVHQGDKYIFAGEIDGHFDSRCHTHHATLRAAHIFRLKLEAGDISARDQLAMFLIAEMVSMFHYQD